MQRSKMQTNLADNCRGLTSQKKLNTANEKLEKQERGRKKVMQANYWLGVFCLRQLFLLNTSKAGC